LENVGVMWVRRERWAAKRQAGFATKP